MSWLDSLPLDWLNELGGLSDADFTDLGDLGSLGGDFGEIGSSGGGLDWSALGDLADYDFGGNMGDYVYDTVTGEFVDASTIDPSQIDEAAGLFGDSGDFGGESPDVPNVSGGPSGTSLSDQLRSRAADSMTEGTEPFDVNQMADPSASIASAGRDYGDLAKTLAKGLSGLLGGAGKALGGLGEAGGGGGGLGAAGGGGQMGEQLLRRMTSGADMSSPQRFSTGGGADYGSRIQTGDRLGSSPVFSSGASRIPQRGISPAPMLSSGGGGPDQIFSSGVGSPFGLADLGRTRLPSTPVLEGDPLTNFHAQAGPAPTREGPSPFLDAAIAKFLPIIMQQQSSMPAPTGPPMGELSGLERLLREHRG